MVTEKPEIELPQTASMKSAAALYPARDLFEGFKNIRVLILSSVALP